MSIEIFENQTNQTVKTFNKIFNNKLTDYNEFLEVEILNIENGLRKIKVGDEFVYLNLVNNKTVKKYVKKKTKTTKKLQFTEKKEIILDEIMSKLSPIEFLIFSIIKLNNGFIHSATSLSKKINLSEKTINKAIKNMIKSGTIKQKFTADKNGRFSIVSLQ